MKLHSTAVTLVPEVFFSLGATELSGEAAIASRSAVLTLTFLAAGEREDLWHPGYTAVYKQQNQAFVSFKK